MNRAGAATLVLTVGVVASGVGLAAWRPASSGPAPVAPSSMATYKVDPVHSSNAFRVKHSDVAYFYGWFNKMGGTFEFDPSTNRLGSINISIDTTSVDTRNEDRDKHLRSADFFSAQEFPEATFRSTSIEERGDGVLRVTGDLTIRGTTKTITADVRLTGTGTGRSGPLAGFETDFTINRRDFGVNYGTDEALSNEVNVHISVEGIGS